MTALCRHTARAVGLHLGDPADVLRWVHDTIAGDPDERFATLAYGVLDDDRLSLALGGHPHPLLVSAAGEVRRVGTAGTVLGILDPELDTTEVALAPGEVLVLYTDGITDAPGDAAMSDEELGEVVAAAVGEPLDAIGERVRAALAARRPGGSKDDVALLLLRRR